MLTTMCVFLFFVLLASSIYLISKTKLPKKLVLKKLINQWFGFIGFICILWMILIGTVTVVYFIPSFVDYKLIDSLSNGTGWSFEMCINMLRAMGVSITIFWIFILIIIMFKMGKIINVNIWHYTGEEKEIYKMEKNRNNEKLKKEHPLLYKLNHNKVTDKLDKIAGGNNEEN